MRVGRMAVALALVSMPIMGCMGLPNQGLVEPGGRAASPEVATAPAAEMLAKAVADSPAAEAASAMNGEGWGGPGIADRKLVRDAALVIGVGRRDQAVRAAGKLAERLGGYVQEATTGGLLLRVPADRFGAALEELGQLGLVSDRKVQVRDVTEQYVDLELRLKSKRAMLVRLEALAAKAEKVEDLLRVEQEVSRLTLEIEQLEGKLRLLASQTALSRIAVEFVETARAAEGRTSPRLPFWWLQSLGLQSLLG